MLVEANEFRYGALYGKFKDRAKHWETTTEHTPVQYGLPISWHFIRPRIVIKVWVRAFEAMR